MLPPDASALGWRTDQLLVLGAGAIGAIAAFALLWLIWAVVRPPRPTSGRTASAAAVALVAAIVAVDVVLFVMSTAHVAAARATDDRGAPVRIEVSAHQWAWQARYPGADGDLATGDDAVTSGELVIPVDRPIVVQLRSADVIHSFYLPSFRVKQDVIPGRTTVVRFRATAPGRHELACSLFCGVSHHRMAGTLAVVTAEEFAAWERARSADGARFSAEHARAAAGHPDPRAWGWAWVER